MATFKMPREPPMKKVLMIAYHYPPPGSGVFRTLKFTKYLLQFDFKPYVLTVKNPMYITRDSALLREIPPEVNVFSKALMNDDKQTICTLSESSNIRINA